MCECVLLTLSSSAPVFSSSSSFSPSGIPSWMRIHPIGNPKKCQRSARNKLNKKAKKAFVFFIFVWGILYPSLVLGCFFSSLIPSCFLHSLIPLPPLSFFHFHANLPFPSFSSQEILFSIRKCNGGKREEMEVASA